MEQPKVSIVIPFYNCKFVDQSIRSALNQTYPNIEIIVVDDGSSTNTEKINPFRGKIKYIKKENGGTATAVNYGISQATGEYIAWLSSDDYFLPNKISKQIAFMLKNQADASFTNYDYVDSNNNDLIKSVCPSYSNTNEVNKAFLNKNPVNGCTVVLKKEIFNKLGYFNPELRYTHDYDMWFRLVLNGYKFDYLDEELTKLRAHEKSGTRNYQSEIQKEIKMVREKYLPRLKDSL